MTTKSSGKHQTDRAYHVFLIEYAKMLNKTGYLVKAQELLDEVLNSE